MIVCHQVWFCYIFRFFLFYLFLERRCYGLISHMPVWVFSLYGIMPVFVYLQVLFCQGTYAPVIKERSQGGEGLFLQFWGDVHFYVIYSPTSGNMSVNKQYMFDPFESFALMRALFCLLFSQDVIPFPRQMLSPASVTATSWCELVVCSVLTSYSCIFLHVIFITSRSFQSYPLHSFYHFYIIFLRFCAPQLWCDMTC